MMPNFAGMMPVIMAVAVSARAPQDAVQVLVDSSKPFGAAEGLHTIEFCRGCPDPHLEGSQTKGLGAYYGPQEYRVAAELTYAVPNDGFTPKGGLMNSEDISGRIVLFNRGQIPLVDKVLAAQRAGAVAVIIADDGKCTEHFDCGRVGSIRSGGFSNRDPWAAWREVEIPALLVMSEVGKLLKSMLRLDKKVIPGFGEQCIHSISS